MEIYVMLQGFQINDTYTITFMIGPISVVSTLCSRIKLFYIFMMWRDKLYPVVKFKKFTYLNYFIMEKKEDLRGEPNFF